MRLASGISGLVGKKSALEADCSVFPTIHEAETQRLVMIEATSDGLLVNTTSWRGVPEGYEIRG